MVRRALLMIAMMALPACGQSGSESADAPNNGAVTLELPPPTPFNDMQDALPAAETNGSNEAAADEIVTEKEEVAPEAPAVKADEPQEESSAAEKAEPPKSVPTPDAGEVKLLPARVPLPDAAIARTIERIGFDCGEVLSSNRVDNPGGETAYKINCSSGKAYQGTMKGGRMFFREWTGRLTRD